MTTDPNRTWSGQELAAQLQIKLHNLLTQLAEWSRQGFLRCPEASGQSIQ
jgi:hypothetical protein